MSRTGAGEHMSGFNKVSGVFVTLFLFSCSSVPQPPAGPVQVAVAAPAASQPDGTEACRAAVASAAARSVADTSVLATESSRAGLAAKVALRGATRPWLCIASPEGVVQNVSYMGEG